MILGDSEREFDMFENSEQCYIWFEQMKKCYDACIDEISKKLFLARFAYDIDASTDHYFQLLELSGIYTKAEILEKYAWIKEYSESKKPVYLYGAGARGKDWYDFLTKHQINIVGFFDRNYQKIQRYCGVPVFQPPFEQEHFNSDDFGILITTTSFQEEIYTLLCQAGIRKSSILPYMNEPMSSVEQQYFDFPQKYQKGAFVDAGSMDCATVLRFIKWCQNQYTHIFVFEPDPQNVQKCLEEVQKNEIRNIEVFAAGLGKTKMEVKFSATNNGSSCVSDNGNMIIKVVALDDIVKDTKVSFIKMDIEGSELNALKGAKKTIQRDRPLLAISIYHKAGDILFIMDYLKQLVPDYQFAIRHYSLTSNETVLYAFI